jgi:cytochrome c peroxidase
LNLVDQVRYPLTGLAEMGLAEDDIPLRLERDPILMALHSTAFGSARPSLQTVSVAIASYVESLAAFDSEFDRWRRGEGALTASAQSGMLLFLSKGKCVYCHFNSVDRELFTDMKFHNTGVAYRRANAEVKDAGRYAVTRNPEDSGKFRTPSLRNVAVTGPYFHDGSAKSLNDVVEFYNRGGRNNPRRDLLLTPLHLTALEKEQLIAFLASLTDSRFAQSK